MDELKLYALDGEAHNLFEKVSYLWGAYKSIVSEAPNKTGADKLLESSNALLEACHKAVLQLEAEISATGKVGALNTHTVNEAGRLRMFSQRIQFCALTYRRNQSTEAKNAMASTVVQLKETLDQLAKSKNNTSQIDEQIERMQRHTAKFDKIVAEIEEIDLYQIMVACDLFLVQAEELTKFYQNNSNRKPR